MVGCPFKKELAYILCGSTFDKEKVRKSFTKELSIWLQEEFHLGKSFDSSYRLKVSEKKKI